MDKTILELLIAKVAEEAAGAGALSSLLASSEEERFRLLDLIETLNDNAHGYLVRIEALKEELRDARAIISHDERAEAAE